MTEKVWLTCKDPTDMLRFVKQFRKLKRKNKQRKQRLFSVACCWRNLSLISDERIQNALQVVERFADDEVTNEELQKAEAIVNAIWLKNFGDDAHLAFAQLFSKELNGLHVSTSTLAAAFRRQMVGKKTQHEPLAGRMKGAYPEEEEAQSKLIRCIFGNPFRRITLSPSWLTATVHSLATGIYTEKAFDRMPVLADALQDAGCANEDILNHCRQPGEHCRGCWVVDLLLENSRPTPSET